MKTFYESQVSERDGQFLQTVTLSRGDSQWTSPAAPLKATDWDAANAEAHAQLVALHRALSGAR
jgi:hypothetical protein